jgi:hypothetical protein
MAAKRKKVSKVKRKCASLNKEFMDKCVQHIAEKIVASRETPDGRTPRGLAERLLKEGKECFPLMNMNMINYAIKKVKEKIPKVLNTTVTVTHQTCISSLTGEINSGLQTPIHNDECAYASSALLMFQTSLVSNETTHNTPSYTIATPAATANTSNDTVAAAATTNISDDAFAAATSAANASDYGAAAFTANTSDYYTSDYGAAATNTLNACYACISDFIATAKSADSRSAGRPKGTTNAATKSLFERIEVATKEAAEVLKIYTKNGEVPKCV